MGSAKLMPKMKWAICSCCEGNGAVDHPAFSNGFTSDEWGCMDFDERETYLSGAYDVVCPECRGSGKVQVPNVAAMTFAEKRVLVEQRRERRFEAEWASERSREMAAERRMGC